MFAPRIERIAGPLRPAHRPLHGARRLVMRGAVLRALIERHHDIAAEQALDFHRPLRRQHMTGAVDMAGKGDAFLAHLRQRGKAHHLIAAAIGQDRPVPSHETVQPAQRGHALRAGPQHQMIGVAQNDVGACRADLGRAHRLDGGGGAHRHESWGANIAAPHADRAGASLAVGRGDGEGETGASHAPPLSLPCPPVTRPTGDAALQAIWPGRKCNRPDGGPKFSTRR